MQLQVTLPIAAGVFLLSAVVIVASAVVLASAGDVIATRTRWGRLWVGTLLVAGATALPELVTNVAAVRIGAPGLAAGNIMGANMLNMCTLAIVIALVGGRQFFRQVMPQQALLLGVAMTLTGVATLLAAIRLDVKWLILSPASLVILVTYVAGSNYLYRRSVGMEGAGHGDESPHSLAWGWTFFAVSAVLIFLSAPFLASSADRFAELAGISESFVGVLAVAIVTTLPELTATITAMRIRSYDLAISGMSGTNAFNVAALAVADLFHAPGSLFGALGAGHVVAGLFAVLLMGLCTVQVLLRQPVRHLSLTRPSTGAIVGLYLVGLLLVYRLSA